VIIQVATTKGIKEVTAYQVSGVPGLAVHRMFDNAGQPLTDAWGITHINSGRHIKETNYNRRAEAMEVARRLGEVTDWTGSETDLLNYRGEIAATLKKYLHEKMVIAIENSNKQP